MCPPWRSDLSNSARRSRTPVRLRRRSRARVVVRLKPRHESWHALAPDEVLYASETEDEPQVERRRGTSETLVRQNEQRLDATVDPSEVRPFGEVLQDRAHRAQEADRSEVHPLYETLRDRARRAQEAQDVAPQTQAPSQSQPATTQAPCVSKSASGFYHRQPKAQLLFKNPHVVTTSDAAAATDSGSADDQPDQPRFLGAPKQPSCPPPTHLQTQLIAELRAELAAEKDRKHRVSSYGRPQTFPADPIHGKTRRFHALCAASSSDSYTEAHAWDGADGAYGWCDGHYDGYDGMYGGW